jgi:hypothetical protein
MSTIAAVFTTAWLVIRLLVIIGIPAAIITRLAIGAVRFARLPRAAKKNYPAACWHRLRWRALARRLDLARPDPHRGGVAIPATSSATIRDSGRRRLLYPRAHFTAHRYGLRIRLRTIPGVGREQVEAQAEHLANALGAWRVSITQPKPRRLEVAAYRTDPLCEPFPVTALPRWDGRHLYLGRDEHSTMRRVSLPTTLVSRSPAPRAAARPRPPYLSSGSLPPRSPWSCSSWTAANSTGSHSRKLPGPTLPTLTRP